ncbi:MAG: Hsp20/alpha crystallin family protein [Vicinamibacterales bacterium]
MAQFSFVPTGGTGELAEDVRELFEELAAGLRPDQRAVSGECHPTLDVLETDDTVEVVVDVSGVPPEALRVLFRAGVLIVAGEKAPAAPTGPRTFHLVEREFGRFARAVRLSGAFDPQNGSAMLRDGELTIVLPKLVERRGRAHRIAVTTAADRPA